MKARTIEELSEKVEALDRSNRKLRGALLLLTVLLCAMLMMGAGAQKNEKSADYPKDCQISNKALSEALQQGCGEIRGSKFIMVDSDQRVRAELFVKDDKPNFVLYGQDGKAIWSAVEVGVKKPEKK